MSRRRRSPAPLTWILVAATGIGLSGDTLVMRDGRRVRGELIAVRNGTIEFELDRGYSSRDRLRVDRADVARIELDDDAPEAADARRPARPPGLRERDVDVPAHLAWTDTGVTVRPGQTVYFSAIGRVRWGPGRQDGPGGERNSPRNDARPMPGRPAAALIGRIGESDEHFFVGAEEGPLRIRGAGRLYLGINDDFLADNRGSFRVTVYY